MTSVWPSIVLRCAQLSFGVLIAVTLASTVSFARSPRLEVAPLEPALAATSEVPALESFAIIEQRNIFRWEASAFAISGPLPKTVLDVELLGTVVVGDRSGSLRSLALLRDGRKQVTTVYEGEPFAGGKIRVVRIEHRRIVIDNSGLLEVVSLASEQEDPPLPEQRQPGVEIETRASPPPSPSPASDAGMLETLRAAAGVAPAPPKPSVP